MALRFGPSSQSQGVNFVMGMRGLPALPSSTGGCVVRLIRIRLTAARTRLFRWLIRATVFAAAAPLLAACTNSMLASARGDLAAKNYALAHQDLEAALQNPSLRPAERREASDDLCLTEFVIGAPTYSLLEQHQTCAQAALQPGNASEERLAKIDAAIRQEQEANMERALKSGDVASAVAAVRAYEQIAPGDTQTLEQWNQRIWSVVDRQDRHMGKRRKNRLHQTLAILKQDYPRLQLMNQHAFQRWVGKDIAAAGAPMLSDITISGHTLELKVPDSNLEQSALSPQKFAQINDAFSVWCQCDGATHVASGGTGLPVYLARLNPVMARSEVLVLPWR
jgi:hypothetical protein